MVTAKCERRTTRPMNKRIFFDYRKERTVRVEQCDFEAYASVMNAIDQRSTAYYVSLTNKIIPVRYKFKNIVIRTFLGKCYFKIENSTAFISVKAFDERVIFRLIFDYCKIPPYIQKLLGEFLQFYLECELG